MVYSSTSAAPASRARTMLDRAAFGRRLAEIRKRRSMTQVQIADAVGVTEKSYRQWELGNHAPGVVELGVLADELRCSLDWLIGRPGGEAFVCLVNSRAEAVLLGMQEIDESFAAKHARLGTIADDSTEACALEEFARRLDRVRRHRDALQQGRTEGDALDGGGELEGPR